ncbi:MAG: glycoside hydrolase family 97 protein, partial [Bacteroidales bacterium]
MKRIALLLGVFLVVGSGWNCGAKEYTLVSPNGLAKVVVEVDKGDGITATGYFLDKEMVRFGQVALETEQGAVYGRSPVVRRVNNRKVDQVIYPPVRQKRSAIRDHYTEMEILFREPYRLIFRAYDDGVAYRFKTDLEGEVVIKSEHASFAFPADDYLYIPTDVGFFTHSERTYRHFRISEAGPDTLSSTPFMVDRADGLAVLITEADLEDYPGIYVYGTSGNSFKIKHPPVVLTERMIRDRNVRPETVAPYIAKTSGNRYFPWRVAAFAANHKDIIGNDIVYRLASPCRIDDPSWIKPGRVAWDWWNANNNKGVPFRSGVNTATYKYHIDFAAQYGLEYIILDEGWSVPSDLFSISPEVDVPEICRYAQSKGVGIILWCLWNALEKDMDRALDQFRAWGVRGIKVDFMQRDDQWMVNYYWRVSKAAAERQLMVDFHGSYKPCGIERTWPNMVTREGVKGLEHNKWSADISPDHDCTIPFIRMFAGPLDYTPGAMRNAEKANFHAAFTRPMSQGTRCHQLGLYVILESPLQMLADAPSAYYREPETMDFLSVVPSVWDETVPLAGKVGDYVAVARQSGDRWFIGAITDWSARDLEISLDFLPEGTYELTGWQDGINADQFAEDFSVEKRIVRAGGKMIIKMPPCG